MWGAAVLMLLLAPPAAAQTTSASLAGSVRTTEGQPVVEAVVQARSEATGLMRSALTDARGEYRMDLLAPGRWTVVARLPDGSPSESRSVSLALQQTLRLDFTVGTGLREELRVVAEAPLVDRHRSGGELRIRGEQTEVLPIGGRNVTELALLDASVQVAPAGNFYGERGSVFVVNGQTGRSNSFLVDGLDNNDQTSGTTLNAFFSPQVIREFVVLTHQYSPEFGRASGGVLNILTHQGSNDPGGEFFVQGATEAWNDEGDFLRTLPPGEAQRRPSAFQGGFRFGGPLKRDRAFYFLAYEHQEQDEIVPFIGVTGTGELGGYTVAPGRSDNLFLRTDFNLGDSQLLMVRLSADDRVTRDVNVGGAFTDEFGFRIDERDVQLAASLTSVVSDRLLNEARLLVGGSDFDQRANSSLPGAERPSGNYGGNQLNLQEREEQRIQLVENLTWRRDRHTLKFGLDVTRSRTRIHARFNPAGNFLYTTDDPFEPGDCGDIVANQVNPADSRMPIDCPGEAGVDDDGDGLIDEPGFIYTYPLVFTYIFGEPRATLDDTQLGLFAQDRWQATPRLLLDYGLRYDVRSFTLPDDARVASTIPNGGAGRDSDNVAPRFGFTFTPRRDGRTVIRGGAGIFHDKLVLAFPAVAAITSGTEIGLAFIQGLTFEVTEHAAAQFIAENGIDAWRDIVERRLEFPDELILRFSTAPELDTPYTVQYTLGFDREFGSRGALSANAIRALGHHVPLMRDLNPVVELECVDGSIQQLPHPDPCVGFPRHRDDTTGSIAAITTEGRSWYSGYDVGWRWRGDDGWYSVSYNWSRARDLGSDPLKGGISLPMNSDALRTERGLSDADRRHRFVFSGETGLPWWGLRLSAVVQYASEVPFNVTTGRDENRDGLNNDRPSGVGRNAGDRISLETVNAIRVKEGLAPLSELRFADSDLAQVDLRLTKPFASERVKGAFFIQVFNLLDRFNAGPPEGRITSRNFGRASGPAGPARSFELGLRIGY